MYGNPNMVELLLQIIERLRSDVTAKLTSNWTGSNERVGRHKIAYECCHLLLSAGV